MIRSSAKYSFGLSFARFMALNGDLTLPGVFRMLGGIGPFDFSGAGITIGAVPLTIKFDNGTPEVISLNLSGASSPAAVTVAELVSAINTATPTDILASTDTDTGRVKLECTDTDTPPTYIQLYNTVATIAGFGQGRGLKFIKSDTIKSIGDSPSQKDEETFTTTDAEGMDVEVISDGYRKGFEASVVDTAEDWELLALLEGGTYNETAKTYEVPTSQDSKVYFMCEAFYKQYAEGSNKEADLVGYVKKLYRTCKGSPGDKSHERGFADGNYTIKGTSYKDEDGTMWGDTQLTSLTVEEYEALDLYNV